MEDQDLDSIGIITVEHRKTILDHAKDLPQISPISMSDNEHAIIITCYSMHCRMSFCWCVLNEFFSVIFDKIFVFRQFFLKKI
jgi:hypothetical protein